MELKLNELKGIAYADLKMRLENFVKEEKAKRYVEVEDIGWSNHPNLPISRERCLALSCEDMCISFWFLDGVCHMIELEV